MFKQTMPQLRALNFWTLKQKILDHTIQRTPTIQLLQKIDIYRLCPADREKLVAIENSKEQLAFLKEHGCLVRSTGEMKSHSFVLQFLQLLEISMAHVQTIASDTVSIRDTGNTLRSISNSSATNQNALYYWSTEAPSGTSTYGIGVGTGTTAPATSDYVLETPIAHGTGAGQLQWASCGVGGAGIAGANVDSVIIRTFINGSGGSITVREIGLMTTWASGTTQYNFLIAHDAVNQAVADGEVAVVAYTMRTTV